MSVYTNLPAVMIHVVFSTRGQEPLITDEIRDLLYSFLGGVLESIDCFAVEIGGTSYCPKLWIGAELRSAGHSRSLSSFQRKGDRDERKQRTYLDPLLDEGGAP